MQELVDISWLIPLLPLLGAAVVGFAGKQHLREESHWPIWLTVGGSALLSIMILVRMVGAPTNENLLVGPGTTQESPISSSAGGRTALARATPQSGASPVAGAQSSEVGESHSIVAEGNQGHIPRGPDGRVKAWLTEWYTWFGAGDRYENAQPNASGLYVRSLPGELLTAQGQSGAGPRSASGYIQVTAGALIDPLSAVMLCVVCGVGLLITIFAAGYMKGEEGYWRFFAYLGLFIFAMTVLVMADNLVMLYLGWEGVGLCSYLLIGYHYERPAARDAAKKAFIVNRIGDFGFAIGILLIFYCFGTVSYFSGAVGNALPGFLEMFPYWEQYVPADRRYLVPIIPFALMLGAFGKSAQFPLHVWLPDAMEGPTPVSALIHAATMVTAGVYMIARLGSVFFQFNAALITIALVGAFTALMAATIAMRQFDLKKVFAYSTISQLGYMFVGVAVLAPVAGIFHLATHAFFKALLFLASGVVMHAMLGHLDMRRMSGLKSVLPVTRWLMLIGCLALAGFPLTSGFFSKDEIIHFARHAPGGELLGWTLYIVLLVTAFLTAYYTFRLYFRVFEGPALVPDSPAPEHYAAGHDLAPKHGHASAPAVHAGDAAHSGVDFAAAAHGQGHGHAHHNHEPAVMILPLIVLAIGALVAGFFNFPGHWLAQFLADSPSFELGYVAATHEDGGRLHPEHADSLLAGFGYGGEIVWDGLLIGAILSIAGITLAWYLHLADRAKAASLAHSFRPLARMLESKWYFDEIYDALIVRPMRFLGGFSYLLDKAVVDGAVQVLTYIPRSSGFALRLLTQRGNLQGYAVFMLFGIALILFLMFV